MELNSEVLYSKLANSSTIDFSVQWALVSTFLCILILYSIFQMHFTRAGKLMKKIGGPINLPLIGMTYLGFKFGPNADFLKLGQEMQRKYGAVFGGFVLGHRPFIYVTTVKTAKVLLRSTELDKAAEYFVFKNLVGDGLLISNGPKWSHRRRMLNPSVGINQFRDFSKSFTKQANILVNLLDKEVADIGESCNIEPYVNRCLLDISLDCFIGRNVNAQGERYNDFVLAINGVFEINCERMWNPLIQSDLLWKLSGRAAKENKFLTVVKGFLEKVMTEQRETLKTDTTKIGEDEPGKLLFDMLLEKLETKELTEKDVYDEALTFVTAARDTSARTTIATLFMLALHPEHLLRVQEEVADLFANETVVRTGDGPRLKYLEATIKESMRLLTIVPIFARLLKAELDVGDGIILPKGSTCHVVASLVHRDPEVFDDPNVFRPQRFLENKNILDPFAFLGFSKGRRDCPGQRFAMLSVKSIISHLLWNFDISTKQKFEDVKFTIDLLQRPLSPITFELKRRAQNNNFNTRN